MHPRTFTPVDRPTIPPTDYPEEYLKGSVIFFGRDYIVTPDVLIPRLETESLVRRVRKVLKEMRKGDDREMKTQNGGSGVETVWVRWKMGNRWAERTSVSTTETFGTFVTKSTLRNDSVIAAEWQNLDSWTSQEWQEQIIVVDIGCGSGIIGTSVADLAEEVIFLDISSDALAIAEKNFRTHFPSKKAQFLLSDLLSNIPIFPCSNLLFLANLPYIRDADWQNMSADTVYEPRLALFGWEKTGFELYEKLFREINTLAFWNSHTIRFLFEFGYDQRDIAESALQKYPHWEYSFFADYAGVERFGEILIH